MNTNELDISSLMHVSDIPGIEDGAIATVEPMDLIEQGSNPANRQLDLTDDYSNVRKMLYFQQQMLMEAAKVSLEAARTSEAPRTMEVFATLMGQMTSTNKELLRIHKDMKDITSETTTVDKSAPGTSTATAVQPQITAQNVFVGTPADLMNQVGTQYEARKEKVIEHGTT